jgi:polar amino acid transport system substrate-binding protein
VLLGAYYTDERAKTYMANDPIYTDRVGIVARKGVDIEKFSSLRELEGYTIGYGRGYSINEEFDNAGYLNKIAAKNQVLNLRKFYKGADRHDGG